MAQAIVASDKIVKERPAAVGGFVKAVIAGRARLHGRPGRGGEGLCRSRAAARRQRSEMERILRAT